MWAEHLARGALGRAGKLRAALLLGVALFSGCGFDAFTSPGQASDVPARAALPAAASTPPGLVEIAVGPPDAHLAPGTRVQFTATGLYQDGSRRDLTSEVVWTSADPAVATLTPDAGNTAIVTGVSPGETRITATAGTLSQSVLLTVTRATLVSISVTPADSVFAKGTRRQFIATGLYSDNSTQDVTLSAHWTADHAIVSIDSLTASAGMVSALDIGTTRLLATLDGTFGSASMTVTPASLYSIQVSPVTRDLAAGLAAAFTATGVYSDGSLQDISDLVTWGSTVSSVASMDHNTATALGPGTTGVNASLGGITGAAALKVTDARLVSIAVSAASPTLANGLSTQLQAIGTYTDHSTQDLTGSVVWSSSSPTIASISNAAGYEGRAQSLQPGSATISAKAGVIAGTTSLTVTAAKLVSLSITPAAPTIAKGTQQQFTATGTYTDNSTQDLTPVVTWSTSSVAATISNAGGSQGLATGADVGASTVSATLGGITGSSTLTVTAATLVSIGITPSAPTISQGTQRQFTATGTYTDHSTQDITASVTWSSSNTGIASIDNSAGAHGLASSLAAGSTTISATLGGKSGSTTLAVSGTTLVSITVVPAATSIAKGTQKQFAATGAYSDGSTQDLTTTVTWGSTTTAVATISNAPGAMGLASSLSVGTTTLSATLGSVSGSTQLTVTPATLVSIAVTPASPSVSKGSQQQFTATGTYTDSSTQNLTTSVTWSSSATSVATISNAGGSKGRATTTNVGTTTVSATLGSISGSTLLTVTPVALVSIAVTPANATIQNGTQKQFTATGTYADGSIQNLTTSATWNSSDTSVATISNAGGSKGRATGAVAGTTSIVAMLGSVSSPAATLTVNNGQAYVYVVNQTSKSVSQFTIEADGTLTSIGSIATAGIPDSITIDPQRRYGYVTNENDTISRYTVGTDGTLASAVDVPSGASPISGAIDPSGAYFYVANSGADSISQFSIGAGGTLSSLAAEISTGFGPNSVAIDPLGRALYSANLLEGTVSQFRIGTGGVLTSLGSLLAEDAPTSIAIDPSGRYAYATNREVPSISQYSIGASGALTSLNSVPTGAGPLSIAVDPTGRFVYTANSYDNTVSAFSIGPDGRLTSITADIPSGSVPASISVDPSGRYVYVANSGDHTLSLYTIDVSGALSDNGTAAAGGVYPVAVISSY